MGPTVLCFLVPPDLNQRSTTRRTYPSALHSFTELIWGDAGRDTGRDRAWLHGERCGEVKVLKRLNESREKWRHRGLPRADGGGVQVTGFKGPQGFQGLLSHADAKGIGGFARPLVHALP